MAECLLEMWPSVKEYVVAVGQKKVPLPKNKAFCTASGCCDDPLFLVRVNVFLSFAKDVFPFLIRYRTDAPMLPLLCTDLLAVIHTLLTRFVQPCVLQTLTGKAAKTLAFDPADCANHVDTSKVDIGFAADQLLREVKRSKKISDMDHLSIRLDSKKFLVAMVAKMLKSPLQQSLVRSLGWLIPSAIFATKTSMAMVCKPCAGS